MLNYYVLMVFAPLLVLVGLAGFVIPERKSLTSGAPAYNIFHMVFGLIGREKRSVVAIRPDTRTVTARLSACASTTTRRTPGAGLPEAVSNEIKAMLHIIGITLIPTEVVKRV